MEILGYISSIFMGISLGLIGGGGSILTLPILVYLFGLPPMVATGYSLFIVGITALFGGLQAIQKGLVDFKTGLLFAVPSFLGVYLSRAWVIPALPDPVMQFGSLAFSKNLLLMVLFALLMIVASYSMIRGVGKTSVKAPLSLSALQKSLLIGFEGLIVGSITGMVGAGGGFLIIPALVILVGLPMKRAIATSLFIIAIKSLFGFMGDLQKNPTVDWTLLLSISAIAVAGLFLGSYLSRFVAEDKLKKGFGWFVLIMGSGILMQQLT